MKRILVETLEKNNLTTPEIDDGFSSIERIKNNEYKKISTNYYFWRTYDQKEIDLIEENSGKLFGFEMKWTNKKTKSPKLWLETYENAEYKEINRDNYLDFVIG